MSGQDMCILRIGIVFYESDNFLLFTFNYSALLKPPYWGGWRGFS